MVSRDILGPDFTGTLVVDCYSGYHAQVAGAKQKCLAHLARTARTARDWQKLADSDSTDYVFFQDVRQFVKQACKFHRDRKENRLSKEKQARETAWLRTEFERLSLTEVKHGKLITLQGRLLRHLSQWLVFIDDPRVPPTNKLAERALRPLALLRKMTFGSRSESGADRIGNVDDGCRDSASSRTPCQRHLLQPLYSPSRPSVARPLREFLSIVSRRLGEKIVSFSVDDLTPLEAPEKSAI